MSLTRIDTASIGALRELLAAQPTTDAKVRFAWTIAAGSSLARAASVSWSESGTLTVRPRSDAWRQEIVRARALIVERMAAVLGSGVVRRIVVAELPQQQPFSLKPRR